MRYHAIVLLESLDHLACLLEEVVDYYFSDILIMVLHPDQPLAIEVKRHSVLVKLNFTLSEALEGVLFQITHVDGWWLQELVLPWILFALQLEVDHAVEVHEVQSEGSLAVGSVCVVVWMIYDLPELSSVEGLHVHLGAGDIAD